MTTLASSVGWRLEEIDAELPEAEAASVQLARPGNSERIANPLASRRKVIGRSMGYVADAFIAPFLAMDAWCIHRRFGACASVGPRKDARWFQFGINAALPVRGSGGAQATLRASGHAFRLHRLMGTSTRCRQIAAIANEKTIVALSVIHSGCV